MAIFVLGLLQWASDSPRQDTGSRLQVWDQESVSCRGSCKARSAAHRASPGHPRTRSGMPEVRPVPHGPSWTQHRHYGMRLRYSVRRHRHLYQPAAPPERHLVRKRGRSDPAVLSAEQHEVVGVQVSHVRDMPRLRAEGRAVALVRRIVRGLEDGLASAGHAELAFDIAASKNRCAGQGVAVPCWAWGFWG